MHFERLQHKCIFLLRSRHDTVFCSLWIESRGFLLFLCVPKSGTFGGQAVFLPDGDVPEQFAVSLQSCGVKGGNSLEADT